MKLVNVTLTAELVGFDVGLGLLSFSTMLSLPDEPEQVTVNRSMSFDDIYCGYASADPIARCCAHLLMGLQPDGFNPDELEELISDKPIKHSEQQSYIIAEQGETVELTNLYCEPATVQ